MTYIISVVNLKGGVGKTAIAVNFAAYCGLSGYKTLLIDLDPQTNATFSCMQVEEWEKSAFGLSDNHYYLDEIGHVTTATVYWRALWDRNAFDLKLLEKCEGNLNKFAEQNSISIVNLETTIIPRSLEYISQTLSMSNIRH